MGRISLPAGQNLQMRPSSSISGPPPCRGRRSMESPFLGRRASGDITGIFARRPRNPSLNLGPGQRPRLRPPPAGDGPGTSPSRLRRSALRRALPPAGPPRRGRRPRPHTRRHGLRRVPLRGQRHLRGTPSAPITLTFWSMSYTLLLADTSPTRCTQKDWHLVKRMAEEHPAVVPCFGLHPW